MEGASQYSGDHALGVDELDRECGRIGERHDPTRERTHEQRGIEGARRRSLVPGSDAAPSHAELDDTGGRRGPGFGNGIPDNPVNSEPKPDHRACRRPTVPVRTATAPDRRYVSRQDNRRVAASIRVKPARESQQIVADAYTAGELTIAAVDVERALTGVAHHHGPARHDREAPWESELPRTVAGPSNDSPEAALRVDDHDPH